MKSLLILATTACLLAAPTAMAQDACDEADPCIWVVEVDETRLAAPGGDLTGTVGDWFAFQFLYVGEDPDEPDHTVAYDGTGDSWTMGFEQEYVESDAFQLVDEGSYTLTDDVSGATLPVSVTFDDVSNGDDGDDDNGAPGLGLLLTMGAVGAVLLLRRR